MRSRWLGALWFLTIVGDAGSAWAAEGVSAIRLPAIITRWATPGEDDIPEISADEVGRCMGADATVRGQIAQFDERRAELDARSKVLLAKAEELVSSSRVIDAEKLRLDAVLTEHGDMTASFAERRSRIDRDRATAGKSPEDTRHFNELVRAFNDDVDRANAMRRQLVAEALELARRVEAHNALVRAARAEFDVFESESRTFVATARHFMTDAGGYFKKCAGQRRLKRLTPE